MSFYQHIQQCNNFFDQGYIPWKVAGKQVGYIKQSFAEHLKQWPDSFTVTDSGVEFLAKNGHFRNNSDEFLSILTSLVEQGIMPYLHGEQYVVTAGSRRQALFEIDRAAAAYFGVKAFGQHLNAYVIKTDGLYMWISQRAKDRIIFPGRLDNLAAGGLPIGIGLAENLAKECYEEAGIPAAIANTVKSVGAITYNAESERGYKPDTLYCYDLLLPDDFQPVCTDGEVEDFFLMPIEQVMQLVRETNNFKPNCNLVIIDFLIRHAFIQPDDEDYLALVQGLHAKFIY